MSALQTPKDRDHAHHDLGRTLTREQALHGRTTVVRDLFETAQAMCLSVDRRDPVDK